MARSTVHASLGGKSCTEKGLKIAVMTHWCLFSNSEFHELVSRFVWGTLEGERDESTLSVEDKA